MLRHNSSHHHHQQHRYHQSIAAAAPDTMAAASSTPFSLFFPLQANKAEFAHVAMAADGFNDDDSHSSVTTSPSSPSSSSTGSVDCTLSLCTPSSRRAAAETTKQRPASSCGAVSWDVAATVDQSYGCCCYCQGGSRPSPAAAAAGGAMNKSPTVPCAGHGQEPMLVDRRCANCGTSSTPLWRNGPRGPKSLCNACGIRFKKEERRAAATAAMDQGGCGYFAHQAQYGAAAAAAAAAAGMMAAPVLPYGGHEGPAAFPCDVADAEAVPPQFLAWRVDVVAPSAHAAAFAAVCPERSTVFQYN